MIHRLLLALFRALGLLRPTRTSGRGVDDGFPSAGICVLSGVKDY